MLIDLILDRRYDDSLLAKGITHAQYPDGKLVPIEYVPKKFYDDVSRYIGGCGDGFARKIASAMDLGTEKDVQDALCEYVIKCNYALDICDYIRSRNWLQEAS